MHKTKFLLSRHISTFSNLQNNRFSCRPKHRQKPAITHRSGDWDNAHRRYSESQTSAGQAGTVTVSPRIEKGSRENHGP